MLSSPKIHSSYTTEETKSCRSGMGVNVDRMFFFFNYPFKTCNKANMACLPTAKSYFA